jgi:DNA-binding NtrC family response regulator
MASPQVPSILVVDDEPRVRSGIRRVLAAEGLDVTEASSGAEALAVLRQRPVDVILSDLTMPGMEGLELLCAARIIRPDAVRIILTGSAGVDACVRAINDGAVFRFLLKPWENVELSFIIRLGLRQRRVERRLARMEEALRRSFYDQGGGYGDAD